MKPPSPGPSPAAVATASDDSVAAVRTAGLRYSTDSTPGIRRRRHGRGWRYLDADGAPVQDPATLERIRAIVIPPAWSDVWINTNPRGHIQATGRDARGRKQYRYHSRWRAVRDETKYSRMADFARALPTLRDRITHDLALPAMPREKTLAAVVHLLDETLIRVGNAAYARDNGSYGLTTLQDDHVEISGANMHFAFRGKSGKLHEVDVRDRRMARLVRRMQELPGQDLFQYVDDEGALHTIGSEDVNAYLQAVTGEGFTAKDFRTWAGTVLAARFLREAGPEEADAARKAAIVAAVDAVAARLGNTRAVCRSSYIHPAILLGYEDGALHAFSASGRALPNLDDDEHWTLAYLTSMARGEARTLPRQRTPRGRE